LFVNHLTKFSTTQYTPLALAFSRTHSCSFTPLYTFLFLLFLYQFSLSVSCQRYWVHYTKEDITPSYHFEEGMLLVFEKLGCWLLFSDC
jgi:hypothetical protein